MQNPEISNKEYQQGTLYQYEVREYLLEKFNRTCAYCGAKDVPLEVEHTLPKSKGGSNRVSNLAIACVPCNQAKSNLDIQEFLADKPSILKRVLIQATARYITKKFISWRFTEKSSQEDSNLDFIKFVVYMF
ncbi:MAG: HNH endonuclease [Xenococcaceae cyanobacterium MO_207.B15]|nr:HNH endonuclease [Xenococcaceae cyanobacterium MO_207.B15]